MATRIVSVLVLVVLVAVVAIPAIAEGTYRIAAVIVSCEISPFGNLEISVVDPDGNIWVYYADEARVGDLVILTVFDFEDLSFEDDEIVDAIVVAHLSTSEIATWLAR